MTSSPASDTALIEDMFVEAYRQGMSRAALRDVQFNDAERSSVQSAAAHYIATHADLARLTAMQAELEAARKANSTRPDYDLKCEECGRAHILDTVIPSEIWNQIAEPHNLLCTLCIDKRLQAADLTAEARFYFVGSALQSELYQATRAEATIARAGEAVATLLSDLYRHFHQQWVGTGSLDIEGTVSAEAKAWRERVRSALDALASPSDRKAVAVTNETEARAAAAILDILNTEALVYPLDSKAKRLASRLARAALALSAPGMVQGWRSMKSAPKDGTDILLCAINQTYNGKPVEDRVTIGHWATEEECRVDIGDCGGDCHCREYEFVDPTWISWDGGFTAENPPDGWMPLPLAASPTQTKGAEQ